MGRRYLKHSNRYPTKLRHLRRTWVAAGVPPAGNDSPIANKPYAIKATGNPWRVEIIGPSPKQSTSWSIVVSAKVISTGVAVADVTVPATVAGGLTAAAVATALAAAVDANAALVSPVPSAGMAQFDITLADALNIITHVNVFAVSNAPPIQPPSTVTADADAPAPTPAPSAKVKKAK